MRNDPIATDGPEAIAIVGLAGRFPGARSAEAFFANLCDGVESVRTFSDDELRAAGVSEALLGDARYVRRRAVLDDVAGFDAAFFGMSPREAQIVDPQQRLFLEVAWEALEHAGYAPERFAGPIGVFGGAAQDGYLLHHLAPNEALLASVGEIAAIIANEKDHLTTRVAYKLGLRGPAITVQTACSTSLVAVQLACQSLLAYQCDMALAGGVSIHFPVATGYLFQEGNILSPDGRCRPFDAESRGTVSGDAVGVVVLRRLSDAIADGDHIHAVIRGAAVNNDGAAKVGYTAPSVDGQAEVIALAQALAGVTADTIGYVEAHGTGTPLGDPIEVAALTQAFRGTTDREGFCAVGSLKSNVGHLNTAAGVAALIKAALCVEHGRIPPSLHFRRANPAIDFAGSPFFVNAALREWPPGESPRRAGVSSFGFGGTNAHVIVEEPPPSLSAVSGRALHLLPLSARTAEALSAAAENLAAHLEGEHAPPLADAAFTLQEGRRAFSARTFVVAGTGAAAAASLRAAPSAALVDERARRAAFLFPGQGAQRAAMVASLYGVEPRFRAELDRLAVALEGRLGLDLRALVVAPADAVAADALLSETRIAQPALFAVEIALAAWWRALGVEPAAMIGHSLGEYVAATLAGVFSEAAALDLVVERGRLMQSLPAGAMLATPLGAADLAPLLDGALALAAINGPSATVASGPTGEIEQLAARLAERGVATRRLRTSHAFHSSMMEPILGAFGAAVRAARPGAPSLPFVSNLTGDFITAAEATDPEYWVRHLRETVRFGDGVGRLCDDEALLLVEVGPGQALSQQATRARPARHDKALASLGVPEGGDEARQLLETAGRLWCAGLPIAWHGLHTGEQRRRVALPTYPFERRRYWIDLPARSLAAPPLDDAERLIRERLAIRPLDGYGDLGPRLDALCTSYVVEWLASAGVDVGVGAEHDVAALRRRLGVLDAFDRLFAAMIEMIIDDGVAERDGDRVRFVRDGRALPSPASLQDPLAADFPGFVGLLDFLAHAAAHWQRALTGEIEAISVLYPGGSPARVADFTRRTVEFRVDRVYIELLVEAVRRRVEASAGRMVRILEIGGGQGLLTWPLATALSALDGAAVDYHFTDLGRSFVEDARAAATRRGFGDWMRFDVLDAARDPATQGFASGAYDLVVAYNVVHATPDVRAALAHLRALVTPAGCLAIVEVTRTYRWDALTWGLAEGWWYFSDDIRTDSPLLPIAAWETCAREAGFPRAVGYPREAGARAASDHGLLLAGASLDDEDQRPRHAMLSIVPPAPVIALDAARQVRAAQRAPWVAPRTETERTIAAIVEEILGVEKIGVHDDFFELGADSLITLRITDRVRQALGADLPQHAAFRGSTVERMARALDRVPDIAPSSPLVPIQPRGSQPPLFFVHPAAGVVFPYFELARQLGPDRPFYGLQALGLDGQSAPDERIDAMARHYIEAIRVVQPRGPYFLGGFSFGCLVAFEMAQQLVAAGESIAMLALVDEPAPVYGHRPTAMIMGKMLATGMVRTIWPHLHDYFYLVNAASTAAAPGTTRDAAPGSLGARLKQLAALGGDGKIADRVQGLLARATIANFVPPEHRLLALRQPAMVPMFQLFLIHMRQTLEYQPRAYPHRITLLRATRLGSRYDTDATMGWGQLAAGGVDVEEIPGEHLTVLRPPHVTVLARKLAAAMDAARPRSGASAVAVPRAIL